MVWASATRPHSWEGGRWDGRVGRPPLRAARPRRRPPPTTHHHNPLLSYRAHEVARGVVLDEVGRAAVGAPLLEAQAGGVQGRGGWGGRHGAGMGARPRGAGRGSGARRRRAHVPTPHPSAAPPSAGKMVRVATVARRGGRAPRLGAGRGGAAPAAADSRARRGAAPPAPGGGPEPPPGDSRRAPAAAARPLGDTAPSRARRRAIAAPPPRAPCGRVPPDRRPHARAAHAPMSRRPTGRGEPRSAGRRPTPPPFFPPPLPPPQVNVPKAKRAFCKGKACKKHQMHKVTQYKTGKASLYAQGKRRYDRKQSGFGGQTKPVFHKKAKTTKKIVLRLQCQVCGGGGEGRGGERGGGARRSISTLARPPCRPRFPPPASAGLQGRPHAPDQAVQAL